MYQVGLFLLGAVVLGWVSSASLRAPGAHGIPRYFAWLAILALLVMNVPYWFVDRFALHQLVSWSLLLLSPAMLIAGVVALRRGRRADIQRHDDALFAFERTSVLITDGIYRWVRHPLYASLLLLAWGVVLKQLTFVTFVLGIAASGALWLTALRDEAECLDYFGDGYRRYMQRSKRFVPWVV